jgi:predicted nucleotidyltransferase
MEKYILKNFAEEQRKEWIELFKAEDLTKENFEKIKTKLGPTKLFSSDADLVVFGSIARNECTLGSDVDWTLLVDGQVNPQHFDTANFIEEALVSTGLAEPGKNGMFGQTTFGHELIHCIGGEDDTNHNISRRILLLLESDKIFKSTEGNGTAYDRVIRAIIQQYIDNDSGFTANTGKENVPRFLLNDFVRFWRTMCVDFAFKQKQQKGKKWALRNIKLRMSRRLIFIKGLLMCFKFYKTSIDTSEIKEHLRNFVDEKPLPFLISILIDNNIQKDYIADLLESYNTYLGILNNKDFRDHLETLEMDKAYGDPRFEEARKNSHRFQSTLSKIFIEEKNSISEFTLKYGIF